MTRRVLNDKMDDAIAKLIDNPKKVLYVERAVAREVLLETQGTITEADYIDMEGEPQPSEKTYSLVVTNEGADVCKIRCVANE